MSQNGPYSGQPWGHGSSDEPYSEPADPWGDQGSMPDDSSWGGHQQQVPPQPFPYHSPPSTGSPMWGQPPPPPPRRNTSMVALVITLGVLICIGLGATAWLLNERSRHKPQAQVSSSSATNSGPAPQGSEDARFYVKEGDCVINEGTDAKPEMKVTPCTSGTYKVLKQIKGTTTGVKDAEAKCAKVAGYTKWYYYDSPLDDLDFVLCLKEE